jgi:hypothetical protein
MTSQGVSKRNQSKIKASVNFYSFLPQKSFLLLVLVTHEKASRFSCHEVPIKIYRHCLSILLLIHPSLSAKVALGPAYEL